MRTKVLFLIPIAIVPLLAQEKQGDPNSQALMLQILQRLDALEHQNEKLVEEVHALKQQLAASNGQTAVTPGVSQSGVSQAAASEAGAAPEQSSVQDEVSINQRRIEEQAQTKVEASQKFPIRLDGMLLFNAFANTGSSVQNLGDYGLLTGPSSSGATVRQTQIGFQFQGPSLPFDGRVNGSLMMDFGAGYSEPGASWLRLRQADLSFDWQNRSFSVGQEQPIISPYQPTSFAEVVIPPLAGAGNLWYWLPEAKYEERLHFNGNTGLTGQIAVIETNDSSQYVPTEYQPSLEGGRPALEGRFAFWHKFDDVKRIEFAPGFHVGTTHVAGSSVPSRIATFDWRIVPFSKLAFNGTIYHGRNVAGLGSLGNGFVILPDESVRAVLSSGGWAQMSLSLTSRLSFNVFTGLEDDQGADLPAKNTVRNLSYAANLIYHLGPNVVVSLEGLQMRTRWVNGASQLHNHYDLALAYLF